MHLKWSLCLIFTISHAGLAVLLTFHKRIMGTNRSNQPHIAVIIKVIKHSVCTLHSNDLMKHIESAKLDRFTPDKKSSPIKQHTLKSACVIRWWLCALRKKGSSFGFCCCPLWIVILRAEDEALQQAETLNFINPPLPMFITFLLGPIACAAKHCSSLPV